MTTLQVSTPLPSFGEDEHAVLTDLVDDLSNRRGELAELLIAEKEQRVRAYAEFGEGSVSGADRYADGVVLNLTTEIIKLKAEIAALEDQVRFYTAWMTAASGV